jgi:hypothetical protein
MLFSNNNWAFFINLDSTTGGRNKNTQTSANKNAGSNFMKLQEHIDNFSLTPNKILNQKNELGNEIVET